MPKERISRDVLAMAFAVATTAGTTNAQPVMSTSGTITNTAGAAISDVRVSVHRGPGQVGINYSEADGRYSVEYDSGEPISIWYRRTEYHDKIVEDMSGKRPQKYSPVMIRRGELTESQYKEVTEDLTRIVRSGVAGDDQADYEKMLREMTDDGSPADPLETNPPDTEPTRPEPEYLPPRLPSSPRPGPPDSPTSQPTAGDRRQQSPPSR